MTNVGKAELDNEQYVYPGTDQIITNSTRVDIIQKTYRGTQPGQTWIIDGRYVYIHDTWAEVPPMDYAVKTKGGFKMVHEDEWAFNLIKPAWKF